MTAAAANSVAQEVAAAARQLSRALSRLRFADPVSHVYNPLIYARRPHEAYIARFATGRRRVLFLGMNPGPFGMAQTGVPFGAIEPVRDWLRIEGPVSRPRREHPKRPVQGFDCPRQEVSGQRLWGAVAAHWRTPGRFFKHHFIANYCPLLFLETSGRNRTPDKLPAAEREPLFRACDRHLGRLVDALEPEWIVGIGAFAEGRASEALAGRKLLAGRELLAGRKLLAGRELRIARILHPSPANPRAQKDWGGSAARELADQGVCRR